MKRGASIWYLLLILIGNTVFAERTGEWNDPQYVASLPNNDFFKAIKNTPELLANEYVFASIDTRLRDPNVVAYLNKDEKLLQYWSKKKGIEFDVGAGFTKYEKGYITTKDKGVVFKPEDMPGARVLSDGSVLFGSARIEEGKAAKSVADEVMVQGTVVDTRTKTRFNSAGFNIGVGVDMYSIRETVAVTTVYGSYTLNSKQWFKVGFDGNNPLITGTNVEIVPRQDDNVFTLEKGSVILYDTERFGLATDTKVHYGDALTGTESDAFLTSSTFDVKNPTNFCFTECNGIEHILPESYTLSSIEILGDRQFENYEPVSRLKITVVDANEIGVMLQNPDYESIYADAHHNGNLQLTQYGKTIVPRAIANSVDAGYPTRDYYSEAVISGGDVKIKGDDNKPLGGSALLVPSADILLRDPGVIGQGYIRTIDLNNGDIGSLTEVTDFNLKEYHLGKPLEIMKGTVSLGEYIEHLSFSASVEEIVDLISMYAVQNHLSLEEAYDAFRDKGLYFHPADESGWKVEEELGIDPIRDIREAVIQEAESSLGTGEPLSRDVVHIITTDIDEIDDEQKRLLIFNYFKNDDPRGINAPSFDDAQLFYDLGLLSREEYLDIGETILMSIDDEELIGLMTNDWELMKEETNDALLREKPPHEISREELGAYTEADIDNDNFISESERIFYNSKYRRNPSLLIYGGGYYHVK